MVKIMDYFWKHPDGGDPNYLLTEMILQEDLFPKTNLRFPNALRRRSAHCHSPVEAKNCSQNSGHYMDASKNRGVSPPNHPILIGFSGFPLFSPSILGGSPLFLVQHPYHQPKKPYYYKGEIPEKITSNILVSSSIAPQNLGFLYVPRSRLSRFFGDGRPPTFNDGILIMGTWQFFVTFLGWLSDPFKG